MVDNLKRFREPAAWIVLAIIVAGLVLATVRLVLAVTADPGAWVPAFQDAANSGMSLTMVVLLVALVCVCHFWMPPTPGARRLGRAAAAVVTLGTLATGIAWGIGLSASAGALGVILEALGGLLDLLLKVLAAVALFVINRATSVGRLQPAPAEPEPPAEELPPAEDKAPVVWKPTEAAGSVWRTAADAAAGGEPEASPPQVTKSAGTWRRIDSSQHDTPNKDEIP